MEPDGREEVEEALRQADLFDAADDDAVTYWMRAGAAVGLMAIGLQAVVEFSLQMPGNAALFAVLCAIAMRRATLKAGGQCPPA